MIILRCFSELDPETEKELDQMYEEFIEKDKPCARKKLKVPVGLGLVAGAGLGAGLGALPKNKKILPATIIGATAGSIGGYALQKRKQSKEYKDNKRDLRNVLKGYGKTREERSRFLDILRQDLDNYQG